MTESSLKILDSLFAHAQSSSGENKPKNFTWDRVLGGKFDDIVITDNNIPDVDYFPNQKAYGWLLESPAVTYYAYESVKSHYLKFEKVFTFKKELLDLSDIFELLPIGGCWIPEEDTKIYSKTKPLSIIASDKNSAPGHKLRHAIVSRFPDSLEAMGSGYRPIDSKLEGLKDYSFSIVVENCKEDYYFTEKLIDCFATGAVPIFWGCPSIGNFFNTDGVIQFDSLEDLDSIIPAVIVGDYKIPPEAVEDNFNRAFKYRIADDILWERIKALKEHKKEN